MELSLVATADPPPSGVPNPVHRADGAAAAGYQAPLVAGVRTYGWAVAAIVASAGEGWVDDGWVDFSLPRPLFAGEPLLVAAGPDRVSVLVGDRPVLSGTFGRGEAAFAAELAPPDVAAGQGPPDPRPTYTLENAPVGEPLRPLAQFVSAEAAGRLATEDLGVDDPRYLPGDAQVVHPYFVAARMAPLTRHNFTYGPTIHVRSQIQHRRRLAPDQEVTIGARIVETYERNGHWYQVLDGVVSAGPPGRPGDPVAIVRHHTIFRPRGT